MQQYYPNFSELQEIRDFLPKKVGIEKAAKKAAMSENHVYQVLSENYNSHNTIIACLDVLIEDAKKKKVFAENLKKKMQPLPEIAPSDFRF